MQRREQDDLIVRSAVAIDAIDQLLMPPHDAMIIVWIDTSDRPELADLGKEDGYFLCTWIYNQPEKHSAVFSLRVQMRQPSRVNCVLGFKVATYYDQLATFAQQNKLWLVPGPPPAMLTGTRSMRAHDLIEQIVNAQR